MGNMAGHEKGQPQSKWTPRIKAKELLGPVGQSALVSGLALGSYGGPAGFVAGAAANLLAEEGTRRLQEQVGDTAGLALGTGLSMAAGAPAYKAFPSYATVDMAEEALDAIPAGRVADAFDRMADHPKGQPQVKQKR